MGELRNESMLGTYRVLDLADNQGFVCGKVLGDMGADVIKVEPPGGDHSRDIGPFCQCIPDREKSLYWWAYNTSKRGITLDITKPQGKKLFKQLVQISDVVVESFPPGYMENLELGYSELSEVNPKIIMTRITPFGQEGPYRDYKATDIICMAMSGCLYITGDADRRPVTISLPHAFVFAGAEGAAATAVALFDRENTGEGQCIDVSAQQVLFTSSHDSWPWWAMNKRVIERAGPLRKRPQTGVIFRQIWPCKDGFVAWVWYGGVMGAHGNKTMVELIDKVGIDVEFMRDVDWTQFDWGKMAQEEVDRREKATIEFLAQYTKDELMGLALEHNMMLYPLATAKDILSNLVSKQLKAREFWTELEHPELGRRICYTGPWIRASETPVKISRRAPLIGEHNQEVYRGEVGLSSSEVKELELAGVI